MINPAIALIPRSVYLDIMASKHFDHVEAWVFDLDNTLYPPEVRLFDQIEIRMTRFVMEALGLDESSASRLRVDYWRRYGTTLTGLMDVHGVDPGPYLTDVHDIDFSSLEPDPELAARISDLPGRRIVYTNGCAPYADRVIEARGLSGVFHAVYGVEHAGFRPKPERRAFEAVFSTDGLATNSAAMFEDDPRNLEAPYRLGMRTVHVAPTPEPADHIHHHTSNLSEFLGGLGNCD